MDFLEKYNLNSDDFLELKTFNSRDGFCLISESDFISMIEYFEEYSIYEDLIPIITDNNSNYWCLYYKGILKGMVCHLSHDEVNLEPKFANIHNLLNCIKVNNEAYDFEELSRIHFDFPSKTAKNEDMLTKLKHLKEKFRNYNNDDEKRQLIFSYMVLTPKDLIEKNILPFITNEDIYIQERAIDLIGFHKYEPVKLILMELIRKANPNDKKAYGKAIKEFNKNS